MRIPAILAVGLLVLGSMAAPVDAKKRRKKKKSKPPAYEKHTADADTMRLVEHVVKTDASELKYVRIEPFMAVPPASLPGRLRLKWRAKKLELDSLRKIAAGKRKPPIRRAGKEDEQPLCPREEGTLQYVKTLSSMGFEEISDDEERFLMRRLKCSECELQAEFSLTIVIVPPSKKNKKPLQFLFLNKSDPIMAMVAKYRRGSEGGTDFFGAFYGACH